jgi:murein DD-endopeptidase MepM/ murein hydrolase activator NlpD
MQIIWIPGSTSEIKRINITSKSIIKVIGLACLAFILLGAVIHFLGFRFAVQFKPDLAREIGGVITVQEKQEIESGYRAHLEKLQIQLTQASDQINKLQSLKDRFTELATPAPLRHRLNDGGGKGGPYLPLQFSPQSSKGLSTDFEFTLDRGHSLIQAANQLEKNWQRQYQWLSQLPTAAPIANRIGLSSNYGSRIDPITRQMAQHPGIDFSAPPGTPILAAGHGVVLRTESDHAYGQFIEIKHSDGFVTKYAHARKIFVIQGQPVTRGQVIAEVGNTGRSTGPHLHYEVSLNGSLINPMQVMASQDTPKTER